MPSSRIPALRNHTYQAACEWYESMAAQGLLFHPDDAANEMVFISSGTPMFTADECEQIDVLMVTLFKHHGQKVYEAAYPHFINSLQFSNH